MRSKCSKGDCDKEFEGPPAYVMALAQAHDAACGGKSVYDPADDVGVDTDRYDEFLAEFGDCNDIGKELPE